MNREDEHTFDGLISSPSPVDSRLIYIRNKNTNELWTYDLNTNEIQPDEPRIELPPSSVKAYKQFDKVDIDQAIKHLQLYKALGKK
ncbi:hypothetical protein [Bacillus litorisediminis]|uniref:hypothetical protein n=1 Tax=Bacillus litorisediminis TaxID=2922713 RepID=UPI001FACBB5F|nr:hypothetical protein [Bacillus litorisediminis]